MAGGGPGGGRPLGPPLEAGRRGSAFNRESCSLLVITPGAVPGTARRPAGCSSSNPSLRSRSGVGDRKATCFGAAPRISLLAGTVHSDLRREAHKQRLRRCPMHCSSRRRSR